MDKLITISMEFTDKTHSRNHKYKTETNYNRQQINRKEFWKSFRAAAESH